MAVRRGPAWGRPTPERRERLHDTADVEQDDHDAWRHRRRTVSRRERIYGQNA
jgi:hypothetical protein